MAGCGECLILALFLVGTKGMAKDPSSAPTADSAFGKAILDRHNCYRVGVAGMKPLSWNQRAAQFAFEYTKNHLKKICKLEHSTDRQNLGENLASKSHSNPDEYTLEGVAEGSVDSWYEEIQYYVYKEGEANTFCNQRNGNGNMIGHFTQVMWEETTGVGCSYVTCTSKKGSFTMYTYIVSCNYEPPGNYRGRPAFSSAAADKMACSGYNQQFGGLPRCGSNKQVVKHDAGCSPDQLADTDLHCAGGISWMHFSSVPTMVLLATYIMGLI